MEVANLIVSLGRNCAHSDETDDGSNDDLKFGQSCAANLAIEDILRCVRHGCSRGNRFVSAKILLKLAMMSDEKQDAVRSDTVRHLSLRFLLKYWRNKGFSIPRLEWLVYSEQP